MNKDMTGINLYNAAKEAYYNDTPIMSDYEFDELEASLGLENKSYVGTRHNPSYTIKHPIIMGSLSKVQIKEDSNGHVDWDIYANEVKSFITHYNSFENGVDIIITPKYDGCSFEVVVDNTTNDIISISSRGDGEYGKDILSHLSLKVEKTINSLHKFFNKDVVKYYILRGEVLINKTTFENKYSSFVNPRSFVSGVLNRDFNTDEEFTEMLNDLDVVVYDIRVNMFDKWTDIDWMDIDYDTKPNFYLEIDFNPSNLAFIYNYFADYRKTCEYALDGFVIKPVEHYRNNNNTLVRPKDCVAVKFIPMLEETVVEEIVWSTRKTNEMIPVVKVKPVIMDGKVVSKASGHNYGYLIDNKISVGTKVILSLAGDIIPFIYKITDTTEFSELKMNLPEDEYPGQYRINGCHLYKELSKEELTHKKFVNSCSALNIPGLGGSNADKIYEYLVESYKGDEFLGIDEKEVPNNILYIKPDEIICALGGKTGKNIAKAFNDILTNITLKDIIASMAIESCGAKIIEQIEKELLSNNGDFSHLNKEAYDWIYIVDSPEYQELTSIMTTLNKTFDNFREIKPIIDNDNKIPVILTGEPNNYKSKNDFLNNHPEYRLTGSWKEVQIVFTNDLESNTGKMKKAREKNIEIRLY